MDLSNNLGRNRDELNFSEIILLFDASNLCTDICKTIFVILEVQFHHEGCLSGSRYFELLFSGWSIFSPCKNSASSDPLFKLFWTLTLILAKFSTKNVMKLFWCKIWVLPVSKSAKFLVWWVYWMRNKCLLLSTFCIFQNPTDPLNL